MTSASPAARTLEPLARRNDSDSERKRKVVCFSVGDQRYGIDIDLVREIRAWTAPTALPQTPDFVRGVINLRGMVVPILDLRARFGQRPTEPTKAHVVIVVQIGARLAGILVDTVSDIVRVADAEVREVPEIGGVNARECLDGLITVDGQLVALISTERIVAPTATHGSA